MIGQEIQFSIFIFINNIAIQVSLWFLLQND